MGNFLKASTIPEGIYGGLFEVNPDTIHWILPEEISWRINVEIHEGNSDRRSEGILGSINEEEFPLQNLENPKTNFWKSHIQERYLEGANNWKNLNRHIL